MGSMSIRVRCFGSSEDDFCWFGRRFIISLRLREQSPKLFRVRRVASLRHIVSLASAVRYDERRGARNFPMKIPFSASADPSSGFLTTTPRCGSHAAHNNVWSSFVGKDDAGSSTSEGSGRQNRFFAAKVPCACHQRRQPRNKQTSLQRYPSFKYLLMERCEGGKSCAGNVL
jgi:hypothetical protein